MAAPRKVRVPQVEGTITFTPNGDPDAARTFQVENHLVSPRSNDEQDDVLRLVEGARLATPKELGDKSSGSDATGGNSTGDK